jgi:hypothetical protein
MKILLIAVGLLFSLTFAQGSPQQGSSSNSISNAAPASDDEELILDDDDDIQKANQQVITTDTTKKGSAPAVSAPSKVINKADDDELKLDGDEENILEPVKQEKLVVDSLAIHNVTGIDSVFSTDSSTTSRASVDTLMPGVNPGAINGKTEGSKTDSSFVKKNAEPQIIGATGSINFARNLKDYRSPKIAMLMSLVIPGSGQVYAAHHSWKAAIYGAVEVGMIATSAAIRSKGLKKENDAHRFADQHFSLEKYMSYNTALKNNVDTATYSNIFPFGNDTVFQKNALIRNRDFYGDLKENATPYVHGWDDATPVFDANLIIQTPNYYPLNEDTSYLVYPGKDSTNAQYGFSENQKIYSSEISKADGYFRSSKIVLVVMLLNHVVSAIDAGITAKAHNDLLLNKQSIWQHIGLEQMYVSVNGTMVPGYALKVRF